jgi:hypothetical protein
MPCHAAAGFGDNITTDKPRHVFREIPCNVLLEATKEKETNAKKRKRSQGNGGLRCTGRFISAVTSHVATSAAGLVEAERMRVEAQKKADAVREKASIRLGKIGAMDRRIREGVACSKRPELNGTDGKAWLKDMSEKMTQYMETSLASVAAKASRLKVADGLLNTLWDLAPKLHAVVDSVVSGRAVAGASAAAQVS